MASDVILLTGPPGAGKTTTARRLAQSYPLAVHLQTDDFWHAIVSGGIPPFLPESNAQNHTVMRVIQSAAYAYAIGGFTTIVDGIIGPWMLDHFPAGQDAAVSPGLHYVVLRPSRRESVRRAQARTSPDALVDEAAIVAMWDQLADLGKLETHVIDTTNQDPAQTLAAVQAAIAAGRTDLGRHRAGMANLRTAITDSFGAARDIDSPG